MQMAEESISPSFLGGKLQQRLAVFLLKSVELCLDHLPPAGRKRTNAKGKLSLPNAKANRIIRCRHGSNCASRSARDGHFLERKAPDVKATRYPRNG